MNKAYEKTGFDSADSKLYVKIFPNNDGGCEMFVTKEHVHKSECKENKGFIFTTSDTDGLFMLCNRMKSSGFFGKSQLYCDDENKFYLLCCTENNLPSYISSKRIFSDDFLFANEYGNVFGLTDITKAYLEEHMTLICDDLAVERITK
jgi:negative regulator of genetic competence, sporulation and motility